VEKYEKETRTWAMVCHLAAFVGFIGIPLGHILGPLVVWLIKRNDYPFVDDQGKEALNFQISITIYGLLAFVFTIITLGFGAIVVLFLIIAEIILVIIAAVAANKGEYYRYPFTIRFLK
jgi:hypothetical protein